MLCGWVVGVLGACVRGHLDGAVVAGGVDDAVADGDARGLGLAGAALGALQDVEARALDARADHVLRLLQALHHHQQLLVQLPVQNLHPRPSAPLPHASRPAPAPAHQGEEGGTARGAAHLSVEV